MGDHFSVYQTIMLPLDVLHKCPMGTWGVLIYYDRAKRLSGPHLKGALPFQSIGLRTNLSSINPNDKNKKKMTF